MMSDRSVHEEIRVLNSLNHFENFRFIEHISRGNAEYDVKREE